MMDRKKLRGLAEKATPGPWRVGWLESFHTKNGKEFRNVYIGSRPEKKAPIRWAEINGESCVENAEYIAAVDSATVLALLDELDAKDARIEKLRIGLTAIADDKYGCARGLLKHVDMAREVLAADDEAAKG